ncbi:hypothetical protein [uncultured Litoreibacter sp.]|uniref:hypothetical protein n=1 Tax=uncultured Litoreibacter sp. TaxID=1392394 RepID=UPI0026204035|nr:hypothetical protein [uncultured Litoreibacter sp.]
MAHSFISYKEKSEMFRDSEVFLIIGLMRETAKGDSDQPVFLNLDRWFFGYDEFPSGALDLGLNDCLSDQATRDQFSLCIQRTIQSIRSLGAVVPGAWLSEILDDGDRVQYNDRDAAEIVAALNRFHELFV